MEEMKVEDTKPTLRSQTDDVWVYQVTSLSNLKKKVNQAIKSRISHLTANEHTEILVISSSKIGKSLLNKGLFINNERVNTATIDEGVDEAYVVLLIDNYFTFPIDKFDNLKNWFRCEISQLYGSITFRFCELFRDYSNLEKVVSDLESESDKEASDDFSPKGLEHLTSLLQSLNFENRRYPSSQSASLTPQTATVNTVTTSISDKLSAPAFRVDFDDAHETMNTMQKLIGILGEDSVGTLILKFCNQNNLHHLIANLSQESLTSFPKFKEEFLKRYSYTDCSQSFLTINQNPGEDEYDLLERCKRRILIMRDDGDLQTELTRSESHLIRERFLSSLSDPAIRMKLRAEVNASIEELVKQARAIRKAQEFENKNVVNSVQPSCFKCGWAHHTSQCRASPKTKAAYNRNPSKKFVRPLRVDRNNFEKKSSGHFHKRPNGHFEKRSNFRKQPFYQGQTGQNSNKKICLNKLIAGTLIIRKMVIMTIIKEITLTDFRENLIRKVEIAGSHLTGK